MRSFLRYLLRTYWTPLQTELWVWTLFMLCGIFLVGESFFGMHGQSQILFMVFGAFYLLVGVIADITQPEKDFYDHSEQL